MREFAFVWVTRGLLGAVILVLGWVLLFGEASVFEHMASQRKVASLAERWANLNRQNNEMLLWLQNLERDPINQERLVAEERGFARPGTVIFRFDADARGVATPAEGGPTPMVQPPAGPVDAPPPEP